MSRRGAAAWATVCFGTLLALGLVVLAHGAVLGAPFRADDHAALVVSEVAPWRAVVPPGLGLGAQASLWVSRAAWGTDPSGWRVEALFWLAFAAVGWSAFTRRLLLPWTGSDHAVVAGRVSGLLLLVHPLAVAAVGAISSRGELLAFCALAWAGATFLRGRQDRRPGLTASAVVLALLGATASGTTMALLPPLLVVAEVVSAHRYRGWRGRSRTALTTGVVFGGAVALGWLAVRARTDTGLEPWGGLGEQVAPAAFVARVKQAVSELGTLVLPASPRGLGAFGTVVAGALFLLGVQPAATAARSAPRLWGWLLFGWFGALFVSVVLPRHAPLAPGTFDLAWGLFASVGVLAFGLGLSVTAVKGMLRTVLSGLLVLGYAALALGNARAWPEAGERTQELLEAVSTAHVEGRTLLVVDPPAEHHGVRAAGRTLAWIGPRLGLPREAVHGVASDALALGIARLRERDGAFPSLLVRNAHDASSGGGSGWRASLSPPTGGTTKRSWRGELRSPDLDLDPREVACVSIRALVDDATTDLGELGWSARDGVGTGGAAAGAWWREAGELRGQVTLEEVPAWLLAGRVRRLFFGSGRGRLVEATIDARLPEALAVPDGVPSNALADHVPAGSIAELVIQAPDLSLTRSADLGAAADVPPRFRAPGATAWLEARLDGHLVARSRVAWPPDAP